jgi:hypothetical protein
MPTKTTRKPEDAKQPSGKAEIAETDELGDNDLDAVVGGLVSSQLSTASAPSRAGSSSSSSESSSS